MEIISNFAEILLDMMENDIEKLNGYRGVLALSPIFVFVLFYLGVSMLAGDFYKMPVSVRLILTTSSVGKAKQQWNSLIPTIH